MKPRRSVRSSAPLLPAAGRTPRTRLHWLAMGARRRFRSVPGTGVTLTELVVTTTIVAILASVAVPVVQTTVRKNKEVELRRALRTIRGAIDQYKMTIGENPGAAMKAFEKQGADGYPPDLDTLVKGVDTGEAKERKIKFLRRIPIDPMTGKADWIVRSNQQEKDSMFWDRLNVFDIRSASQGKALDGTKYSEW